MIVAEEQPLALFPTLSGLCALFLVVMSVRLLVIHIFGSPLPFYDEWDAGAAGLYKPYLDGNLSIWSLFSRFNEHILFTSRVLNLITFELAGEWNVLLQMAVNAAIFAGFVTWFAAVLLPVVPAVHRIKLVLFCVLLFAPPVETEIITMGMNAHFYFVLVFSLLAVRWCIGQRGLSWRWMLGLAMCALAYLSMASGAATPLVAALVCMLQILRGSRPNAPLEWLGIVLLAALGTAMVAFVPNLAANDAYKAHDAMQLLSALVQIASLPLTSVVGVVLVHLPILLLFMRTLRSAPGYEHRLWFVIGAAGWVAAQMLLVAYGRATDVLNARYLAVVPIVVVLNYVAVLSFAVSSKWLRVAGSAWVFVVALAVMAVTNIATWRALETMSGRLGVWQTHVSEYLTTGDRVTYDGVPSKDLPYPDPERLVRLLDVPEIRAILPAELRPADADRSTVEARTLLGGRWGEVVLSILHGVLQGAAMLLALGIGLLMLAIHRATGSEPVATRGRKLA
jgi:hypothetical protein